VRKTRLRLQQEASARGVDAKEFSVTRCAPDGASRNGRAWRGGRPKTRYGAPLQREPATIEGVAKGLKLPTQVGWDAHHASLAGRIPDSITLTGDEIDIKVDSETRPVPCDNLATTLTTLSQVLDKLNQVLTNLLERLPAKECNAEKDTNMEKQKNGNN